MRYRLTTLRGGSRDGQVLWLDNDLGLVVLDNVIYRKRQEKVGNRTLEIGDYYLVTEAYTMVRSERAAVFIEGGSKVFKRSS